MATGERRERERGKEREREKREKERERERRERREREREIVLASCAVLSIACTACRASRAARGVPLSVRARVRPSSRFEERPPARSDQWIRGRPDRRAPYQAEQLQARKEHACERACRIRATRYALLRASRYTLRSTLYALRSTRYATQ